MPTDPKPKFDTTIPLMSNELIQALSEAGVHNIDFYPMILKREDTGEEYHNYKAANVIGRLDALDLENSVFKEEWDRFTKIAIDPSKTHGINCFRLKEGPDLMVVHQNVADVIAKYEFKALLLQPTKEFRGT